MVGPNLCCASIVMVIFFPMLRSQPYMVGERIANMGGWGRLLWPFVGISRQRVSRYVKIGIQVYVPGV